MGKQVDGIYDSDPKTNPEAKRFDVITYDEVLQKNLRVMDASAIALCRDNNMPLIVFSLDEPGGFRGIMAARGPTHGCKGSAFLRGVLPVFPQVFQNDERVEQGLR